MQTAAGHQRIGRAKLAKRPLAFSEDAPDIPGRQLTGKKGLILLERNAGVSEVAIVNYAASIDADIVIAPPVERLELLPLARQLQDWADDRSGPALREVRKKVTDRIKDIISVDMSLPPSSRRVSPMA